MSGLVFTIIFVPLVLFLVIVMPTWLVLHYRDKQRQSRELSVDEWNEIEQKISGFLKVLGLDLRFAKY